MRPIEIQMKNQFTGQIIFHSYNPYESKYPGLRVVSRETLHLIKQIRAEGHIVTVEPEDGTPLCYLTEKGFREFLTDPVCAWVSGIPLAVILNLLSNWLYDHLKPPPNTDETSVILEFENQGNKIRYNQSGQPISDERFQAILALLDTKKRQFASSQTVSSPEDDYKIPIHLEHTEKIIGWSKDFIFDDEKRSIKLDSTIIVDNDTWDRIKSGELKGLSIAGIVCGAKCMICGQEYVECNHLAGHKYDSKKCIVSINKINIAEISIVKEPVQPLAKVELKR
jgi:hypothetical protein